MYREVVHRKQKTIVQNKNTALGQKQTALGEVVIEREREERIGYLIDTYTRVRVYTGVQIAYK